MASPSAPLLPEQTALSSSRCARRDRRGDSEYDLERIFEKATGLREVIDKVRSRSRYWLVKHEAQLYEDSDSLSHISDVFKRYQERFEVATQYKQLEILFSLEHAMHAEQSNARRLMKMFGSHLEAALGGSPGDDAVHRFQDDLNALRDKTFGSMNKTVQEWAEMQRYKKKDIPEREQMMKEEHAFVIWLANELSGIRTRNGKDTLYGWFVHALERSAKTGMYIFMSIDNLGQFVEISEGKDTVRSSPVGWVAEQLLLYESIDNSSFMSADWAWKFQKIRVESFPRFVSELSELCGVIEGQKNTVHDAKSKVMTIFVTSVITGGQLLMKILSRDMQEPQDS